jgi:uncharacterized protein (DUF486 family)
MANESIFTNILSTPLGRYAVPVLLLVLSNVFMTYAWYYHLGKKGWTPIVAIGASWGIAFFEYCLQVPANRMGSAQFGGPMTTPQLKILQEAITLTVFTVFSIWVLKEKPRANDYVAFGLVLAAVVVSFWGREGGGH